MDDDLSSVVLTGCRLETHDWAIDDGDIYYRLRDFDDEVMVEIPLTPW